MRKSPFGRNGSALFIAGATMGGLISHVTPAGAFAATIPSAKGISRHGLMGFSQYRYAQDSVLGTSLDLTICAIRQADADECQRQIMLETERLRSILSTYDPSSEIERVKTGGQINSPELAEVLDAYSLWKTRTDGAIDVNMAEVIRLWKGSTLQNSLPTADALGKAAAAKLALNVDALGKGYIIDRAVEVARRYAPAGLLNIGGDIRTWGDVDWTIGVADPRNFAENAQSFGQFVLRNGAVATSGGYARFLTVGSRRYSHIIDPRTGWPVEQMLSATVLADNCMTANAIATATTVLGGAPGGALAQRFGAGHLLLADTGEVWRGGAIALADVSASAPAMAGPSSKPAISSDAWPKDFQVTININVKTNTGVSSAAPARNGEPQPQRDGPPMRGPGGRRGGGAKRPYIAVWIQGADQKVIRTISLFGDNPRWMPELSYWFRAAKSDGRNLQSITRATRPAGQFALTWDGKDDAGKSVPKGEYTVVIEINREHGRHVKEVVAVICDETAKTVKVNETVESDSSTIEYGPAATSTADSSGGSPRSDAN